MSDKKEAAAERPLCFVIGPIGADGSEERKHADMLLHFVVKHVLEAEPFDYRVRRADEDADPGMIGDRVVTDVINAPLVVADLTGLNPNAFYELGLRHAKEAPTIHIARAGTKLPFDVIAHRTVFVDMADVKSIEAARTQLTASARAIKAPGYKVTNPITQANASFQMRHSADPKDRVIAEVLERLSTLEAAFDAPDAEIRRWAVGEPGRRARLEIEEIRGVPGSDASQHTFHLTRATEAELRLIKHPIDSDAIAVVMAGVSNLFPVRDIHTTDRGVVVVYKDGSRAEINRALRPHE